MVKERNYGIDLLRILAMFFVAILHVLNLGGALFETTMFSAKSNIAWFLDIAAYCGVNCYALISGYVSSNIPFKYSRIISIWLQTVFYTLGITAVFAILFPELVDAGTWLTAVFPVSNGAYWYITTYFGMFFFIPFFNYLICNLERRQLFTLIITVILLFSVITTAAEEKDPFFLKSGYSVLWISCLYLIGGYIKKYRIAETFSKKKALLGYFICILIPWICQSITEFFYLHVLNIEIKHLDYMINQLINYVSPAILFASIFLLLFFGNLKITRPTAQKTIRYISALTLSVYIIHMNPLIWINILKDRFAFLADLHTLLFPFAILGSAAAILIICCIIDSVRHLIFKKININRISEAICNLLKHVILQVLKIFHIQVP